VLLSDTVGFVTKLPHQLVQAFKATLDVATDADLLVHVVDAAGADPEEHLDVVRAVLAEIGAGEVPELLVANKCDAAPLVADELVAQHPGAVSISARTGDGVDALLLAIGDRLRLQERVVELLVPWSRGDVLALLHRDGGVLVEQAEAEACRVRCRLPARLEGQVQAYRVDGASADEASADEASADEASADEASVEAASVDGASVDGAGVASA
jgi:GTP-binding protein HflX